MTRFLSIDTLSFPMEQEIVTLLKEYGLKDEEARIYLFLVQNLGLTAYRLAKELKIHRSTCYDLLERLIEKGFVSKTEKKGKMIFYANNLNEVISILKEKEETLVSLIPKIKEIEREEDSKIRLLDSVSSQKEFNIKLLELDKKGKISFF